MVSCGSKKKEWDLVLQAAFGPAKTEACALGRIELRSESTNVRVAETGEPYICEDAIATQAFSAFTLG